MTTLTGPSTSPASGDKPKQLVLFLHGLGANGDDLLGLADMFTGDFPDAQFIAPNAPAPCDMAPMGYQWFSLQDWSMETMLRGARQAEPILNSYIDEQLEKYSLAEDQLIVVGFSQGTMMALHTMLRRDKPCRAIIGFSGVLLGAELLAKEIKSRPPVCLIHGQQDNIVPYAALKHSADALRTCGVPVEDHTRVNLAHGIDPEGIDIARRFLKEPVKE